MCEPRAGIGPGRPGRGEVIHNRLWICSCYPQAAVDGRSETGGGLDHDTTDTALTQVRLRSGRLTGTIAGLSTGRLLAWWAAMHARTTIIERGDPAVSKRTFQPNVRRRAKTHGFRLRMRTRAGRAIVAARRRRGRDRLTA